MTLDKNIFADYPHELGIEREGVTHHYSLKPEFYAVHSGKPGPPTRKANYLLNEGAVAVFRGTPEQTAEVRGGEKLTPVYSLEPGGGIAVPTGLIFIRLRDEFSIDERQQEITSSGYRISERLDYAPNAAWLEAISGKVADSLNGINWLKEIPDVENVEPQMLIESARKQEEQF